MVVRHKCDVKSCCQISHLELGTQKENARDAVTRQKRGCGVNAAWRKHPELIPNGENEVLRSLEVAHSIEALLESKNTTQFEKV